MTKGVLTFVDTVGVQDYIFRTNALKQIVGASFLVECAARDWMAEALPKGQHNVLDLNNPEHPFNEKHLETHPDLLAEVYLAGGGNALIAFRTEDLAKDFAYKLTRRVIVEAPGLSLAVAQLPFDIREDPMGGPEGALARLAEQVDRAKMSLPRRQGALGIGVTLQCDFTHSPATEMADGDQPISAEVAAKLAASTLANRRLQALLDRIPDEVWVKAGIRKEFPYQLDDLGSTQGEKSLIAVIHTDGNGMGERFQQISKCYSAAAENRKLLDEQQKLSFSVQAQAERALVETIRYLIEQIHPHPRNQRTRLLFNQIELSTSQVPLRPILYGGDDATFLCDGRVGLWLAEKYLQEVTVDQLSDGKKLYSRAGVAIVKAHYPFARAYRLAEELVSSAKGFITELREELESKGCWDATRDGINALDWQVAVSGQVRPLGEIRGFEYHVNQGDLTMRPVYQGALPNAANVPIRDRWRSWKSLREMGRGFDHDWAESHNKIKSLPAILAEGEDAVKNFLVLNDLLLPDVTDLPKRVRNAGWYQNRCVYFDAVELQDLLAMQLEEPA